MSLRTQVIALYRKYLLHDGDRQPSHRFPYPMVPAGPACASFRQDLMSLLMGRKVPKSKAGQNAVREAMYAAFGIPDGCLNARENALRLALASEETASAATAPETPDMQYASGDC